MYLNCFDYDYMLSEHYINTIQRPNTIALSNATVEKRWDERVIFLKQRDLFSEEEHTYDIGSMEEYYDINTRYRILKDGDSYFSVNGLKGKRRVENLNSLNAIFVDIDCQKSSVTKKYVQYEFMKAMRAGNWHGLPIPSLIFDSGRGYHLYWLMDGYYAASQFLESYMRLMQLFTEKLEEYGADFKCVDAAHVLRIPFSYNTKAKKHGKLYYENKTVEGDIKRFSLIQLHRQFFPSTGKKQAEEGKKQLYSGTFTYKTLNISRMDDIKKVLELRKYDIEGYRNKLLFYYGVAVRTISMSTFKDSVRDLNSVLKEPLPMVEVEGILRSIDKYYAKCIDENGKECYKKRWYSNKKIIKDLNITEEEQQKLKTIIGTKEKYRRNNLRRQTKRRDANGSTERQKQLQERIQRIIALKQQGYKQKQVAEELKISLRTVKTYWHKEEESFISPPLCMV